VESILVHDANKIAYVQMCCVLNCRKTRPCGKPRIEGDRASPLHHRLVKIYFKLLSACSTNSVSLPCNCGQTSGWSRRRSAATTTAARSPPASVLKRPNVPCSRRRISLALIVILSAGQRTQRGVEIDSCAACRAGGLNMKIVARWAHEQRIADCGVGDVYRRAVGRSPGVPQFMIQS